MTVVAKHDDHCRHDVSSDATQKLFFQRHAEAVKEDAVFENHAAIACHMANESYFRKKPVYWDAEARELRG